MNPPPQKIGAFVFDTLRGGVFDAAGVERPLRPKAFALLRHLIAHPDRLLDRATLMDAIWPGVFVTDDSLTHLVREVRQALEDQPGRILRTVPGRGYVFAPPPNEAAPAPQPLPAPRARPPTSFVGRLHEVAALRADLATHRLITVMGMGGVGKTRLVLHLLADIGPEQRVFLIDLAAVANPQAVAEAMASAIGAGLPAGTPEDALVAALRPRRALLVLDNAEHVTATLGPLLAILLDACPDISAVVTSRIGLGVANERIFRLDPLATPPPGRGLSAADALGFDAVRLFVDRAAMLIPGFRIDDAGPAIVSEICRKLDGIALAIEMAVPRMQVLTPAQFLSRLDQRFNLLAAAPGDTPPRQRSLRTMLEWSWDQLRPTEQSLLLVMSVFAGTAPLCPRRLPRQRQPR